MVGPERYRLNSFRYDLRKLKAAGLLERLQRSCRWQQNDKGQRLAVLFLLFHPRLCGALTASQLRHRPGPQPLPKPSKLESAYHKADQAVEEILDILRAA